MQLSLRQFPPTSSPTLPFLMLDSMSYPEIRNPSAKSDETVVILW